MSDQVRPVRVALWRHSQLAQRRFSYLSRKRTNPKKKLYLWGFVGSLPYATAMGSGTYHHRKRTSASFRVRRTRVRLPPSVCIYRAGSPQFSFGFVT